VVEARSRWAWSAVVVGAGLGWLFHAGSLGLPAAVPVAAVGSILLAAGVSLLLWPGDRRATEWAALLGTVGGGIALLVGLVTLSLPTLVLATSALVSAWAAGRLAMALEPAVPDVPRPEPSLALSAKVAVDDFLLGYELAIRGRTAEREAIDRVVEELERCRERFEGTGYLEKPETYHESPPPLVDPDIRKRRIAGHTVEILRFESGYAPRAGEPGRERWQGYASCRDAFAYVVRREGPDRPWLVCTNGYRMGHAGIDVRVFSRYFDRLGLNLLIPVLPLHGPRRRQLNSGTGFLGLDVIDTLHAEAQAVWDIRRLLSWIRAQSPSGIGAFGLSLGGYTTALYTSLVGGIDCVIAGIPLADVTRTLVRHAVPEQLQLALQRGYSLDHARDVLRVVSPLALPNRVPRERRMIFGAVADRLVTPDQVHDLWNHWERPEIVWYQGGHVTFRVERSVFAAVDRKLRTSGLTRGPNGGALDRAASTPVPTGEEQRA
jgi:hypothetical protein